MKKSYIIALGALVASSALFTSCLEETIPTSGVTEAGLQSSVKAGDAILSAMPAQTKRIDILGRDFHWDYGYPAMMQMRDLQTADIAIPASNYDQFSAWEEIRNQGQDYVYAQVVWNTYYKLVLTANNSLGVFTSEYVADNATLRGYRAQALAFRAAMYLEMAQLYEFLPCQHTSAVSPEGKNIAGLTVPIVTEQTPESEAFENPRAKHEDMYKFIMADLNEAAGLMSGAPQPSIDQASLGVIYGLMARAYMWEGDYANAASLARQAIGAGNYSPVTQAQWLDKNTGFNTPNQAWMWGQSYSAEDASVKTGLLNPVGMTCNETTYGYAGPMATCYRMMGAELYNRMSNSDFRKLSYKCPQNSPLEGQIPFISQQLYQSWPVYTSMKFRPNEGVIDDSQVANVVSYPMMRVEEMYLIEAEATAHTNPTAGAQLLENFVKTYRDETYTCTAMGADEVVDACFQQKRIEFWGEGLIYFDYKRLNKPVVRAYQGTNFRQTAWFNTVGRPAWMNVVITRQESQNNEGVAGYNNPDYTVYFKDALTAIPN